MDRHAGRALVRADGGARGPDGAQLKAQDQDEGVPQVGEGGVLKNRTSKMYNMNTVNGVRSKMQLLK